MSFDWNEYFDLAQELADPVGRRIIRSIPGSSSDPTPLSPVAGQEARYRTAISRAYYAAFIQARNHLRYVDGDPNVPLDGTAHIYVRDQFRNNPDRRRKQVGTLLDRLRVLRNRADYDNQLANLPANTQTQLFDSRAVLAILTQI
jgi:uncharacterized protein (UPF0332 family)